MTKKKGIITDYSKLESTIWGLTEQPIAQLGAELIDVQFVLEAGSRYLRFYIDRQSQPVDHQLCEAVSNCLDALLDEADPIAESYYLEVSSPGLERPLKRAEDFQRFATRDVAVLLYAPEQGQKEYQGKLIGLQDDVVIIENNQGQMSFPLDKVAKVHLTVAF